MRAVASCLEFTEIVNNDAVTPLGISVKYSDNKQEGQRDYPSCPEKKDNEEAEETCPTLNWDDDAHLHVTYTFPENLEDFKTLKSIGGKDLGEPVKYKIQACFETKFTKNRKWRKPKAVIQV